MSVEPISGLVSIGPCGGLSRQDKTLMESGACVGGDVGLHGLEVDVKVGWPKRLTTGMECGIMDAYTNKASPG